LAPEQTARSEAAADQDPGYDDSIARQTARRRRRFRPQAPVR